MSIWTGSRARRPGRTAALALLVLLAAGCVTTKEGEAMRAETAALKARLDEMDRREAEAKEQVVRLRKVLDEATAIVTRNSADLGAKVQKDEADLAELSGKLAEAQHALEVLAKQMGEERARVELLAQTQAQMQATQAKVVERVAPTIPDDKEQLWAAAKAKLDGGYWEDARRFHRAFLQRFPQDPRAPQAQLFVGQGFMSERKYSLAAAEFQRVLDNYPRAPEVSEAMWQLSLTFVELKFCGDAKALLSDLIKRYPKSPRVPEAKTQVRQIEKIARDRDKCTS